MIKILKNLLSNRYIISKTNKTAIDKYGKINIIPNNQRSSEYTKRHLL